MKHDNRSTSLAAAWAINSLAYSIVYPFIPIYLHEERNIPMDVVGTIFPLMGLAVILAPPVSGWLTDRIGRRFMMQFGQSSRAALFLILAALAFLQAPFWLFAVILMINAGVGTFFQVAADSYLTDLTTPEERPRVYSKIRIGTNIGWAVGPMLGAFLARTPFSLMFAITAVLCMAGTFYTGHCCREVPQAVSATSKAEDKSTVWSILRNSTLLKLLISSFLLFLLTSQLYSVLSVYATGVVGVSRDTLGLVYSVNGFTIIFFQLPVTQLLDRIRMHQSLRLLSGAALYALGYFSLAFCTGGWSLGTGAFYAGQPAGSARRGRKKHGDSRTGARNRHGGRSVDRFAGVPVLFRRSADSMGHSFLFRRHCRNRFSDNENGFPAADELISGRLQA